MILEQNKNCLSYEYFSQSFLFLLTFLCGKVFFQEGVKHGKSTDRPFPYSFLKTDDKIFIHNEILYESLLQGDQKFKGKGLNIHQKSLFYQIKNH